ncbi:hypothetical protein ACIA8G_26730 [Lentzea sp. NPDC051213]|uniref:hypothetical protein n=1 Tax=Lentzea sp. NPDC051213 TaxID=3364126 RepID=UPI00378F53F8
MRTYTENNRRHAVPVDAQTLAGKGNLDTMLFDVTSLAEFGYDAARRTTVLVIVQQTQEIGQRLEVAAWWRWTSSVRRDRAKGHAGSFRALGVHESSPRAVRNG